MLDSFENAGGPFGHQALMRCCSYAISCLQLPQICVGAMHELWFESLSVPVPPVVLALLRAVIWC